MEPFLYNILSQVDILFNILLQCKIENINSMLQVNKHTYNCIDNNFWYNYYIQYDLAMVYKYNNVEGWIKSVKVHKQTIEHIEHIKNIEDIQLNDDYNIIYIKKLTNKNIVDSSLHYLLINDYSIRIHTEQDNYNIIYGCGDKWHIIDYKQLYEFLYTIIFDQNGTIELETIPGLEETIEDGLSA
jgi:hypothetical protein